MAYDKDKIFKDAKKMAEAKNLFFIEDIISLLPCDKTTFYRFFDIKSNEYNELKAILENNRVKTKSAIRAKLFKSEKSAELIALYKLIGTEEERKRLSMSYIELSEADNDKDTKPNIIFDEEQESDSIVDE